MKTRSRALLLSLCAVVLVVATVFGTMAYLTDTEAVTNTFTVGSVSITLDEAKVNEYGQAVKEDGTVAQDGDTLAARVITNSYKLLPGHTYVKDPTVTVVSGSEPSYVRMLVTVNDISKLKAAIPKESNSEFYGTYGESKTELFLLRKVVNGWDSTAWVFSGYTETTEEGVTSATYEFRYKEVVDARTDKKSLDALFESITVPGTLNNTQIGALNQVEIKIVANAIQADGFESAEKAWAAFGNQNTTP